MSGQRSDPPPSRQQQARDVSAGISGRAGDNVEIILWHRAFSLAVIAIRSHSMKEKDAMDRPLEGVRVVELAMWVAGPATAAVLGDWGADVIKLEDPKTGDPIRGFVPRTMGRTNARIRPPFQLDNRHKRSVAVDLRRAEGHSFALKRIERADVFVTSLRREGIARMKPDHATSSSPDPRPVERG